MSSGNGVFINSMGYQLESQGYGNLQVQGKLHLGNSNKTGYDITYSSSILSINPYTSTDTITFGSKLYSTTSSTSVTTAAAAADYTAAAVLSGLIIRSAQTDVTVDTLPTAAAMNALLGSTTMVTGTTIPFKVHNASTTIGRSIMLTLGSGGSYVGVPSTYKCIIYIGETREFVLKMTSASTYDIIPVGNFDSSLSGPRIEQCSATTDSTAGALTITGAMVKGGIIIRDPNGANRTDVLPTPAQMVSAFPSIAAGSYIKFHVLNNANDVETITFGNHPAGVTQAATQQTTTAIAQNMSGIVHMLFTSTTAYTYWVTAS